MSIRIQLIHFLFLCGVSYGLKAVLSDILETSQLLVVYNPTYFFQVADILACLKNDRYNEVSQCEKGNHFCIYMFWSRNNTYVDSFTRDHPHMTSAF